MAEVLYRLNLSYIRPTYVLAKADKKKQEQFKNNFEELKKHLDGLVDTILFQDESMIRDYQAIQKTCFIKGQQRKIPTYSKNAGVKLIGTLDYVTGNVYCEEHERYDAKLMQPFLDEVKGRLELMFLPPYSPDLNLIEGVWGWLKSSVINNVFFPSLLKVKVTIQKFIENINKVSTQTIDRLCVKM